MCVLGLYIWSLYSIQIRSLLLESHAFDSFIHTWSWSWATILGHNIVYFTTKWMHFGFYISSLYSIQTMSFLHLFPTFDGFIDSPTWSWVTILGHTILYIMAKGPIIFFYTAISYWLEINSLLVIPIQTSSSFSMVHPRPKPYFQYPHFAHFGWPLWYTEWPKYPRTGEIIVIASFL